MPELFKQPEPKTTSPVETEKSSYRYIFVDKLGECINEACSNLEGAASSVIRKALDNWFEKNGTSYAQVKKKGNSEQYTFLYKFDIEKLGDDLEKWRNGIEKQVPIDKKEIDSFISTLSGACEKKKPGGKLEQRPNDQDMPFMQPKEKSDIFNV